MKMKRDAALLSLVLLALPLMAAAQTPKRTPPPSSVDDLQGPLRSYFAKMNTVYRLLCDHALDAQDEPSLQKILDQVDDLFREQTEKVDRARLEIADESSSRLSSGVEATAKTAYGKQFAHLIVLAQVRERVRGCVGIAVNSLGQPGVTAGTGTGAGSGTGGAGGATAQSAERCESQAGPFGCTGRFSGTYQVECSGGSGPPSRDAGPGSIAFFSDGTVALRLQGGTTSLNGRIEGSGRVSIVENDAGFSQRWEGRFSVQPAPGGGSRAVGGGTYESRVTGPQGQLNNACQGTFQLPGAPL